MSSSLQNIGIPQVPPEGFVAQSGSLAAVTATTVRPGPLRRNVTAGGDACTHARRRTP